VLSFFVDVGTDGSLLISLMCLLFVHAVVPHGNTESFRQSTVVCCGCLWHGILAACKHLD